MKQGDTQQAICLDCNSLQAATLKTLDVKLSSGEMVNNVLVGVCNKCNKVITLPQTSVLTVKGVVNGE